MTFVNQLYVYLMEKYKWSLDVIDNLEAETIIDLEFGEWRQTEQTTHGEPLSFIDEVLG